ncbi:4-hydroxy-3-methylbut-2-enyl diphosphate reductase [Roseisolibacter sp. H3M3-2]|uniref:4-hydroxy-3-methylbut-2-enyl diphosphate reductase n=1 Tax=Roseisolibacter sp. H3M3-2 TaxID=3031323 RepID=UPI0023DBDB25|nr:4-hydroxy-3-methylbut-2-enyl diphosphate reductase [Roseisolibacter sp. H3M3-2]MDF1503574.1 4-hydroxy-3-methylbut-2-enyl diphosphate reductase [Roseisolibacter sp. H3M3-2]
MATLDSNLYVRKGFGLKAEVQATLAADYDGRLVDLLRARDYTLAAGGITVRLAREFGFCYGVERAVDYAYQTRHKFPDRRVWLAGEIIHNPHVNARLREMGVEFLAATPLDAPGARDALPAFDYAPVGPADVVILPAFGVTIRDFEVLRALGCVVVDTTCGSVLNVWKRVEAYARDGFTALIHGKHYHEETRATASQVQKFAGGRYLVVRDMAEARLVCDYVEGRGDRAAFLARFAKSASPDFDPDVHLARVGVANQTTMLARESIAIADEVGAAIERARGAAYRAENFRSFDTICSATQDRQDAVKALLDESLDVMLVIGGYNSSNTISLAALCAERVRTYHIESPEALDVARRTVRYRPAGPHHAEAEAAGWLPDGPVRVGLTAGASTPNSKIGETVARLLAMRGVDAAALVEAAPAA